MLTDISPITTGAQFEQWARRALDLHGVTDSRPFQTLLDTLAKGGMGIVGQPAGDMSVIFIDGDKRPYLHQTFMQVVQMAKDTNKQLQRAAETSFQTMCLEEDAEELDLLADLARKNRKRVAPTTKEGDYTAANEAEHDLVTIGPATKMERGNALTRQQEEQLAAMSSAMENPVCDPAYGSDFDLAAMY